VTGANRDGSDQAAFPISSCLPGTLIGSPERLAVEQTLANIGWVLARKHRTPRP
jgi:hypothetical protein